MRKLGLRKDKQMAQGHTGGDRVRCQPLTSDFLSAMLLHISVRVCSVMSHSFFSFIFISWRLITSQHFSGFCHVPLFHDPMDCSLPGSSVHGILPAKILEGVAISSSRGSSWPRHLTRIFCSSCLGSGFFTTEPHGKPCYTSKQNVNLTVNLEKNDID